MLGEEIVFILLECMGVGGPLCVSNNVAIICYSQLSLGFFFNDLL